jgi:tRNA dimethylallyltransferase
MKNHLIVLLGPTGVGKTNISVQLATEYNCDIISADSRQFFREMKIGTAVPDDSQLAAVHHHFIRFITIDQNYSSNHFEADVLKLLPGLFSKNNQVIMCGGSGMYIDAVCNGIDDIPDTDPEVRRRMLERYHKEGIESLRMSLKLLDPEHYSKVDLRNHKRIIRALEICESSGKPYSSFLKKEKKERNFNIIKIGLERPREELYKRIDARVDEMMRNGLEEEAAGLYKFRALNALLSVGYREMFDYFDGKVTRDKAIELIKRNSRHYAKRQITWWSKDEDIRWFHPDDRDSIIEYIDSVLAL